jgi:hypothetical protein
MKIYIVVGESLEGNKFACWSDYGDVQVICDMEQALVTLQTYSEHPKFSGCKFTLHEMEV